jgi:alpha-1,6-mannosyltransferase
MRLPEILHTGIPRRVFAGGFLGSCLLAIGGVGSGVLPGSGAKDAIASDLHLTWVKDHAGSRAVSTVLVAIGMVLLAAAWWQLRPFLDQLTPRALLVVAAVWAIPLFLGPPLFSRDIYAYAGQGHLVANDIDPYVFGPGDYEPRSKWASPVDSIWRFSPSPYGPVWLWISGAIVRLSGNHLVPALFGLRLVAILGLLLVAWALPRLARDHGVAPQRALWLGLANPLLLIHGVGGGHNDTLMVGLLACGLVAAGRSPTTARLMLAAFAVTVAALVKLPAAAAFGFLPMLMPTWPQRIRAGVVVALTAAAAAVPLTLATGLGWGWLHTLDAGSARLSIFSPVTGLGRGLGSLLTDIGLVDTPLVVTRLVFAGGLALAGVIALYLLLRSHSLGPTRALGLTMVAVVALSPTVQPWYLVWGLVLLAAVIGQRAELALGALSVALCLSIFPDGRSLVRPPLYGGPVAAAAALAVFEVRRSARKVREQAEAAEQVPVPA